MFEPGQLARSNDDADSLHPGPVEKLRALQPALFLVSANDCDAPKVPVGWRQYEGWPKKITGGKRKRFFDILAGSAMLVFVSPLVGAAALAVWLQDGGSPFFTHERIGVGGRPFRCIKLRTMVKDSQQRLDHLLAASQAARAEWANTRKLTNDPRTTPLGEFLRKSSLDELPQLINVVLGEMSLVGPRPVVADEIPRYDLDRVHYLRARPGLTGLWQVSGRSTTSYERRVELDKTYTLSWSLGGDIAILLRTLPAVLLRRGAM